MSNVLSMRLKRLERRLGGADLHSHLTTDQLWEGLEQNNAAIENATGMPASEFAGWLQGQMDAGNDLPGGILPDEATAFIACRAKLKHLEVAYGRQPCDPSGKAGGDSRGAEPDNQACARLLLG